MPEYCLTCSNIALIEYEKQKKKGVNDEDILVTPPNEIYTWRIVTVNQMPVAVPTCMPHLNYQEKSSLLT